MERRASVKGATSGSLSSSFWTFARIPKPIPDGWPVPLYQRDAPRILHTPACPRNDIRQSWCDDSGWFQLQTRHHYPCNGNFEDRTGDIEPKSLDSRLRKAMHDKLQHGCRIGRVEAEMSLARRPRLQQFTLLHIDH